MPGFTEQFQYYLQPDDEATKTAMTSGMIVLDTNVLLSAYRFAPAARGELLSVLERITDRLWVPNRVAEEFHRNRLQVISDYDSAYLPVIESLRAAQESLKDELQPKIAQLANRAALRDAEREKLLELVTSNAEAALSAVEELRQAHGITGLRGKDEILAKFDQIFDDRTGGPFDEEARKAAIDESERRTSLKLPPGYLDAKKTEPYGDYFVWRQTVLEVKRRSAHYLVFVTGDTKEDWYKVIKGKTVGARPELVRELTEEADAQLIMMNTTSFLFHAREHLNAQVSQETIRQSETLPPPVSDKLLQQNARRREKLRDLNRLSERIVSRQAFISALEKAIEDRVRENPEDDSAEMRVLRNQLDEARKSEKILERRRNTLVSETARRRHDIEEASAEDVENLLSAIRSTRERIFALQDAIQEHLSEDPNDNSGKMTALRDALTAARMEDEQLMTYLNSIREKA